MNRRIVMSIFRLVFAVAILGTAAAIAVARFENRARAAAGDGTEEPVG